MFQICLLFEINDTYARAALFLSLSATRRSLTLHVPLAMFVSALVLSIWTTQHI